MDSLQEEYLSDEEGLDFTYSLLKASEGKFQFVAVCDNKVYGSVMVAPFVGQRDLMLIENIFVDPDFRGVGIGSGLLRYMESNCKEAGFTGVFAQVTGEEEKLYPIQEFFANAGYVCGNYSFRIISYSVEEIVNSRFKKIMDKLKGEKSIKSLEEVSPYVLKEICQKEGITENALNIKDKEAVKLVISADVPLAMILCDKEEQSLCVRDIVILPENKDKGIMMRILSALINDCEKNNLATFIIRTENSAIEEGLGKCMVFPKTKDYEMEFVKSL